MLPVCNTLYTYSSSSGRMPDQSGHASHICLSLIASYSHLFSNPTILLGFLYVYRITSLPICQERNMVIFAFYFSGYKPRIVCITHTYIVKIYGGHSCASTFNPGPIVRFMPMSSRKKAFVYGTAILTMTRSDQQADWLLL